MTNPSPTVEPDAGLDEVVRDSLDAARGNWPAIGKDAASGVSHSWISKFVRRRIPNPGYRTLKDLHAYLRQHGMLKPATQRTPKG